MRSLYLKPSVVTAIEMLTLIKKHRASGLECGEIAEKMTLNYATVNPFLSWLKDVKLVEAVIQTNEKGQPVLYYPKASKQINDMIHMPKLGHLYPAKVK